MKLQIEDWKIQHINEIDKILCDVIAIYDVVYLCSDFSDDRDNWSRRYFQKIAKKIINVKYDPEYITLRIDATDFKITCLSEYQIPEGRILIDSTSLSLPELIHLFQMFKDKNRGFDVIYAQPSEYKEKDSKGLSCKIDKLYDLSDDGLGMKQIPPFVGLMSNTNVLVNLGFEGHRIGALINSDEFQMDGESKFYCFLGVPAFKFGWENEVILTNYEQLSKIREKITFYYSAANDPIKLYDLITEVYDCAIYEKKKLCLVPLGTKPSTLAFALFIINHPNTILGYDFVKKKPNRSNGVELIHIWTVEAVD